MRAQALDLATITRLFARADSVAETEAVATGKGRQFSRADVFELSLADRLPVRHDAHPDRAKRINPAPGGDRCSVVDDSVVLAVHLADRSSTPEWPDDVLSDT